jgi:serine/threonine protein kinase
VKTPAILKAFRNDILPAGAQLLQAEDPVAIGGHRLAGRLRSSGAGMVYVAHDRGAGLVTIKTTHPGTAEPEPIRARLRAEAACARRLPSSCTVRLLDDGTDQTPPFLVGEHVDGPSLERIIDVKGPLPPALVKALAADLAQVLTTVHGAKVVHGNLTPANVLLTKEGLRLIDFGVTEESSGEPAEIGAVADNPGWLPPELLTGGPPGPACDVFGWGCLVAYAATGHSPHHETVPGRPARFRPLETGGLDEPLRRLVETSVPEDPAGRPSTADLIAGFDAHAEPEDLPVPATPAPVSASPAPIERPHAVRRPRRVRARAMVSALVGIAALLVVVPTAITRSSAPPPKVAGPAAPPSTALPRRSSNTAALSLYSAPPVVERRTRPAPKAKPRRPRPRLWMSCSSTHHGWCSLSGGRDPDPDPDPDADPRSPDWRITWSPGG